MTTMTASSNGELMSTVLGLLSRLTPIDPRAMKPEAQLSEMGIDSLSLVELANEIEAVFDIAVDDRAIESFVTIEDIVAFLSASQRGA